MLVDLGVPYQDTSAAALSWWLGEAPAPLDELVLDGPHGRLALRLLGASHQAVARLGEVGLDEVVACAPAPGGVLPAQRALALDGARYRFRSATTTYAPAALGRVAGDLRRRYAAAPDALVGAFPGSPHALTVLRGRTAGAGWAWRTWHAYPTTGEVVRTASSLVPA